MTIDERSRPSSERRRHARQELAQPVDLMVGDGEAVLGQLVDIAPGGARVRLAAPVDARSVRLVIDADLSVDGMIVQQTVDVDACDVLARIVFAPQAALTVAPAPGGRRRRAAVIALAIALVVVTVALVASRDTTDAGAENGAGAVPSLTTRAVPTTATPTATSTAMTSAVTVSPAAPTAPPAPAAAPAAPAPAEDAARTPAAPAAEPAPTTVTASEPADSTIVVTIADDPADNRASSSVGPTTDVDPVRVLLHFTPDATEGGYPTAISIENRGDAPLTFDGGIDAVLTASRDGVEIERVTLHRADITELAPGATVTLEGLLRLAGAGTYEIDGAVDDVTARA